MCGKIFLMGMTLEFICDCLSRQGLLAEKDLTRIEEEAPKRKAKLEKEKSRKKLPNPKEGFSQEITPLNILTTMHIQNSGKPE